MMTACPACKDEGIVVGAMTLPPADGVTEDTAGMMIRPFHSRALNFEKGMPD